MRFWERLAAKRDSRLELHCWTGGGYEAASWGEVLRDSEHMTAGLRKIGVRPGARVAAILTNTPGAVRGIFGVWFAGGTLASLPLQARGMDPEEYLQQIRSICDRLGSDVLVVDGAQSRILTEALRGAVEVVAWESLAASGRAEPSPPGMDDVAFVQYSSGSTGVPKGCMLTPRAIESQADLAYGMTGGEPGRETTVSWLPLSHDMGLFGALLASFMHDSHVYLSTPERFAMSPRSWFRDVAACRGTITVGTNTALAYAARRHRTTRFEGRLDQLKACIIGADRVEWGALTAAHAGFGPHGLRWQALMPAFGLAEATLAVTATPYWEGPRYLSVDSAELADGTVVEAAESDPGAAKIVSSGRPCRGVKLPGIQRDRVTEVQVQSTSLMAGYFSEPARTERTLRPEGVLTGDLGFDRDGYLYLVGRTDDMISVAGRNVYAREIESAVSELAGVRRGTPTIVHRAGEKVQRLTMLAERRGSRAGEAPREMARAAARLAMLKGAVQLDEFVLLERGTLPRTPSGKIQRHRCLHLLQAGRLTPLEVVQL